jgi:hypothetical protein
MRHPLDETYRLIDTTFDMVIILLCAADNDLLRETARLDNCMDHCGSWHLQDW